MPKLADKIRYDGLKILEQDFSEDGGLKISVPIRQKEKFMDKLTFLRALGKKNYMESRRPTRIIILD